MKKYLMIGIAAVAMSAAFTSCSKDKEFEQVSQVQLDESKYQAAFESRFGSIAPNHDWGFNQFRKGASARAFTRGNAGEDYPETSEGINANANEWADPKKEFGGWLVPDPLTSGQKERVKAYFQANPNLGNYDPQWRHFFVQQVYKGGSSVGANSTEIVVAADNSAYDSDNMNLMTVGQNHQHINNFNAGTCSTNDEVLDNGGNVNNGPYHSDEIMLMVNIDDTSCFGYHETGSSTHHDNKWALVSAATIDAWAAQNGNPGEAVVDEWNRSFLGYDLAIKEGAEAYATDDNTGNVIYADYSQAPTAPIYGWDGTNVIQIAEYNSNWQIVYKDEYKNILKGTTPIGWLTTNKNFYIAEDAVTLTGEYSNGEIEQSALSNPALANVLVFKDVKIPGAQNNKGHVINLKRIKELVNDGYLPVKDKSLQEWVKVGKSDGYFSDWIVTLTEAQRNDPDEPDLPEADVRVIVEDMQAAEEWDGIKFTGDFDFNDVVFDVIYDYDDNQSAIILQAAGGTLPLYLTYAPSNFEVEVHDAFGGYGIGEMINTGAGPNADPKLLPLGAKITDANLIVVTVTKPGQGSIELKAEPGRAPHKIAVPNDFEWMDEWDDIENKYPGFSSYVNDPNVRWTK